MNTYVILACLLAVAGVSQGNHAYGYGVPYHHGHTAIVAPAAVSTSSMVRAAPIPVIRTHYTPVITAPVITAPVLHTVPHSSLGLSGYGLGGHGYGSYYGHGHGNYYGHGYGHRYGHGYRHHGMSGHMGYGYGHH